MVDVDNTKSVLLVDDDQFLLKMYAQKFESKGFRVFMAGSADEALDMLKSGTQPSAIVFDLIMPRVDGYGFLEKLGQSGYAKEALKIALSNQSDPTEIARVSALGADGFITKASSIPSEIVAEVERIMGEKQKTKN